MRKAETKITILWFELFTEYMFAESSYFISGELRGQGPEQTLSSLQNVIISDLILRYVQLESGIDNSATISVYLENLIKIRLIYGKENNPETYAFSSLRFG